jgi:PRTRC genetic system protein E
MIKTFQSLLSHGAISITIAPQPAEDGQPVNYRVTILPKSGEGFPPLGVTGTMEEIDTNLPSLIADFNNTHKSLKEQFEMAKKQMEEEFKEKLAKEKTALEAKHTSALASLKSTTRRPRKDSHATPSQTPPQQQGLFLSTPTAAGPEATTSPEPPPAPTTTTHTTCACMENTDTHNTCTKETCNDNPCTGETCKASCKENNPCTEETCNDNKPCNNPSC